MSCINIVMADRSNSDLSEIVAENIRFYHSIKPRVEKDSYTVIATLNDASSLKLLALATGTQASLKKYDNDIEDCHAESLLKRAYKRHVIDKILTVMNDDKTSDKSDFKLRISQIIKEIEQQKLILFVSQFPCGLIKRFEGPEPIDEETGAPIVRKPGRGQVSNNQVVYVRREDCLNKLRRWTSGYGFLGKSLGTKLGVSSNLQYILIGDCEPDSSLDYRSHLDLLNQKLSACKRPIKYGLVHMRQEEFTFQSNDKLPLPVATVWWASSNHGAAVKDTLEYVVDGRRLGITKNQCVTGNAKLKLRSSDLWLREDLKQITTPT